MFNEYAAGRTPNPRLNYIFNDKYLIELNGRYDAKIRQH